MRTRAGVIGVLVTLSAFIAPATGSAATTIGSNLTDGFATTLNCNAFTTGCTATNGPLMPLGSRAPGGQNAPIDGVVVRWRLKSGPAPVATSLRILRPGSSTTKAAVGTSAQEMPTASATSTFDTRLPVQAGDTIGVDSKNPQVASLAGADMRYWAPAIPDGGAPTASASFANNELLVNADVEADTDHDGYGDETQDLCPNEAAHHDGCLLTVEAGKGGTVTGPGIDCPGECSEAVPGGTVEHLVAMPDRGFRTLSFMGVGCGDVGSSVCDLTVYRDVTVSASFVDNDPPDTTIVKGPKRKSSKRKVRIKFSSDEKHSKFECGLDTELKEGTYCSSPFKAKVKPGKHVFKVRAVDSHSNRDRSPAEVKFKVTR